MTRATVAFTATSFLPVPLLVLGASFGGVWCWSALIYLTLLAFVLDEIVATFGDEDSEFPAADGLLVVLGLSHFVVLALVVRAFGNGLGTGEGIALFLATGLFCGQIGNANAHELIHRGARSLHQLGRWVYISMLFGHHTSAHTLVHHRYVGSADDPNTARVGEGYYGFAARAWMGSFRAGLAAENARYQGRSILLHPYVGYCVGSILCVIAAWTIGGWGALAAYLGLAVFAQSQLLMSDYVQHYGLARATRGEKLEPVAAEHSWNAPHVFTSHMMLNAPRHSAHHARPSLKFNELDLPAPGSAPVLPYSLPAMSVIALYPPLWRRMMNPRLAYWQARPLEPLAA